MLSPQLIERYSHLYSKEAKAEIKNNIFEQGSNFRTTEEDRREFKRAFLSYTKTARLTTRDRSTAEAMYADHAKKISDIKSANPDIRHIPTEDLIALRSWTSAAHHWIIVNALEGDNLPENPLGLSYAKAIISALHALPDRFIYEGHVYRGENRSIDEIVSKYREGETNTNWSFFATSASKGSAWQDRDIEWQTHSSSGKCISEFSIYPNELEVLFPPGTQYLTKKIEKKNAPRNFINITLKQLA